MALKSSSHGLDVYTISSVDGKTRASFVPEKGGVGSSLVMPYKGRERELLFLHDHFWDLESPRIPGGWPFLFPICARLERMENRGDYLYDGKIYNLPSHGFGPRTPWQVVEAGSANSITLELRDSEATLASYPFNFTVQLKYSVENGRLICEQSYRNTGSKPMPYYTGLHPYFLTPEPGQGKDDVLVNFKALRQFKYNEAMTDLVGEQELVALPASITTSELNEQLFAVEPGSVAQLKFPDGFELSIQSELPYLQLYTMDDKPFFCVEPWMAPPNSLNSIGAVRWLQPGASNTEVIICYAAC